MNKNLIKNINNLVRFKMESRKNIINDVRKELKNFKNLEKLGYDRIIIITNKTTYSIFVDGGSIFKNSDIDNKILNNDDYHTIHEILQKDETLKTILKQVSHNENKIIIRIEN